VTHLPRGTLAQFGSIDYLSAGAGRRAGWRVRRAPLDEAQVEVVEGTDYPGALPPRHQTIS
jgi:hypothetical protein